MTYVAAVLAAALGMMHRDVAAAEDDPIRIERLADGSIAVSLEGFNSETAGVLDFDLTVQGFKVVASGEAQYQLSGTSKDTLVGRVKDRISGRTLLAREYRGASARAQAHAFSDDFVELFPGRKGIARGRIVFRLETGRNSEIYLSDYDGYNAVELTKDATITRDPVWVPGQRTVLYTSYKPSPKVYSHDLASGARRLVAGYPGLNASTAVSPDGRRIALILSKNGSPDLYVANVDGSGLTQLTKTKEDESSPCWSPDGKTICVVSRQGGRPALYLVSAAGGPMRRLTTTGGGSVTEPSWSPDGKTIAFTASFGGFTICTVPAAGGRITELAAGEDPAWAPNSRTLVFTRRSGGQKVLSLLDVPTKQVKTARRFSGSCSQPDWAR